VNTNVKERNEKMIEKELLLKNPLHVLKRSTEDILPKCGFGAVLARAGVGKTSLMVQIALNTLLQSKNVLHISLNDPVNKVVLWYEEVFKNVSKEYDTKMVNNLWEIALTHRFIMTFQVEGFSVPKLEERLEDLIEQAIFFPHMVLIDGLVFDDSIHQPLLDLKELAKKLDVNFWFAVQTHREDKHAPSGLPNRLVQLKDLFDVAILLKSEGKNVHLQLLKGSDQNIDPANLSLDPSTMLINSI